METIPDTEWKAIQSKKVPGVTYEFYGADNYTPFIVRHNETDYTIYVFRRAPYQRGRRRERALGPQRRRLVMKIADRILGRFDWLKSVDEIQMNPAQRNTEMELEKEIRALVTPAGQEPYQRWM